MNSKTTPQFSLKDLHDWKSGHHHPPVEDSEDFERLATTIKALAAAEKERDEAYAMLECQVDGSPPCHGPGKQDYDMCRACLLSRCRRVERERDEALAKPRTVAEHLMSSYERVLLRRAEKAERERDEARRWLSVQHDAAADHPHMHTLGHHEHSCTLARLHAMRVALDVAERCVEERDALKAALREMVECGEGCPACGDGRQGGCGCRYERAREALGEVE